MKKLIRFIRGFFYYDTSLHEMQLKKIKELQEKRMKIIDEHKEGTEFTEMEKMKMDVLNLKIDNLIK